MAPLPGEAKEKQLAGAIGFVLALVSSVLCTDT